MSKNPEHNWGGGWQKTEQHCVRDDTGYDWNHPGPDSEPRSGK